MTALKEGHLTKGEQWVEKTLQTNKTFEEKITDRIRESIGELITDKELISLIHRGVEKVFLEPKIIKINSYGATREEPSLIHGIVKELLAQKVKDAVDIWIEENQVKVKEVLDGCINKGVAQTVMRAMDSMFSGSMMTLQNNIMDDIRSRSP